MATFKNYSRYYNLLYKDKDYGSEVEYVEGLIKKFSQKKILSILDVGCGTGNHLAHFAAKGYEMSGIDLSADMISVAKKKFINQKNISLQCCDATDFNLGKKFDVIVSLFHVLSYQNSNESVKGVLNNIYNHLSNDGLFIFDFWYGPAVLKDLPQTRIKKLENNEIRVTRLAEPVMDENSNVVTVNYTMFVEDKSNRAWEVINEEHRMRYFFYPELELFLDHSGFKIIDNLEWMSNSSHLNWRNWNGLIISRKK